MKKLILPLIVFTATITLSAQEKTDRLTVEQTKAKYESQIKRLEGVRDIVLATKGKSELLIIEVTTKEAGQLLDNLLSDSLEGYGVIFQVTGKPQPSETGMNPSEKGNADKKEDAPPLCFKCVGAEYPKEKGLCSNCGNWTDSTAFKFCNNCAKSLGVCAKCGEKFKQEK